MLTGDNLAVARTVCQQLGISTSVCVTGAQLADATEEEVQRLAVTGSLFAKLSPSQKLQVVQALQKADKVVGFLGDGTNDALALRAADVGVSVDSGKHTGRCLSRCFERELVESVHRQWQARPGVSCCCCHVIMR